MIPPAKKQKLYCFVDETGQDTKGDMFIVAVVVTGEEVDEVRARLEDAERNSRKGLRKWFHSNHQRRLAYIREILNSNLLSTVVRYAVFRPATDYLQLTIAATARAIQERTQEPYDGTVLIDGLDRSSQWTVTKGLRLLNVREVKKVRGVDDKKEPLIRFADAIVGFVRDVLEGNADFQPLYREAVKKGLLKELEGK